jgi:hypothetical protein
MSATLSRGDFLRRKAVSTGLLLEAALFVFFFASPVVAATVPIKVQSSQQIPQVDAASGVTFKSWTLFLVCNPKWLSAEKSRDLVDLFDQFENFGRTIGDDNAAIWFSKSRKKQSNQSSFKESIDVERSVKLCKAFGLTPSASPHIVVTSTYPDESALLAAVQTPVGLPKNSAIYELGNKSAKEITDILASLADQLLEGKVRNGDTAASVESSSLWIRLLEATQHIINSFGCKWSFTINTGVVTATLNSCKA